MARPRSGIDAFWKRIRRLTRSDVEFACARLPLVAVLACCAGACSGERSELEQRSVALAKAEAAKLPAKPTAPAPRAPSGNQPALYVDASESMAGFVNCMRAPTEFDELLDRLTVDLSITSLTRFGATGSAGELQHVPLGRTMHCPQFYSLLQNPDYALYAAIAKDSTTGVHVYVTDGVQSDVSGANVSPSVQQLVDWLGQGHALGIIAFRSRFDGRAWSETQKRWIGHVTVARRPFYAFIFASTEGALDQLLSRLSDAVRSRGTIIRFRRDAATCRVAPGRLPKITERRDPSWVLVSKAQTDRLEQGAQTVALYQCSVAGTFPLASVHASATQVRYGRWTGHDFTYPLDPPNGTSFSTERDSVMAGGSATPVRATIGADEATRNGFFFVTLAGQPGALRPSVAELSTDSDENPANYDRTYRFDWLVEQLARTQLARQLPPIPFAVTVTYR